MKNIFFLLILLVSFNGISQNKVELNKWLDNWHLAAAEAKFDAFFNEMDDDFIYLGTAPGERWTKQQFANFCKPYFDAGSAWEFISTRREWSFSKNKKIAWFDEDLDTWMRGCRGSGVAVKKKGKWVLKQYNLTVLIENEKIEKFIALRDLIID